jgi:hypothetical protein
VLKKNRLFLLIFPLFFFSLLVFHRFLICFCIQHYAASKSQFFRHAQFSYKQLGYNRGAFYLNEVEIFHPDLDSHKIKIDKVEYKPLIHLKAFSFQNFLSFSSPSFEVDLTKAKKGTPQISLYSAMKSFSYLKNIAIEQGHFLLKTKKKDISAFFSFYSGQQTHSLGKIFLSFSAESSLEYQVKCELIENEKEQIYCYTKMENTPLSTFSSLFFETEDEVEFECKEGRACGEFVFAVNDQDQIILIENDLQLSNTTISSTSKNMEAKLNLINLTLCFNSEQNPIDIKHLFSDETFNKVGVNLDVTDGKLFFFEEHKGSFWELANVSIGLNKNIYHHPTIYLNGEINNELIKSPFSFEGELIQKADKRWKLKLFNMADDEKLRKKCSYVFLEMDSLKQICASIAFEGIEPSDISVIQKVLSFHDPTLMNWSVLSGEIQGELKIKYSQSQLKELFLDQLVCSNLRIEENKKNFHLTLEHIKALCRIDLPFFNTKSSSFYQLLFSKGELTSTYFSKVLFEGYVCYDQFKLEESWIKAEHEGCEFDVSLQGLLDDLDVVSTINCQNNLFFNQLLDKAKSRSDAIDTLEFIKTHLKIKKDLDLFNVVGQCFFNFSKKEIEKVDLLFELKTFSGFSELFHLFSQNGVRGCFESERVSPSLYLLFTEFFNQRWFVVGDVKIKGEINSKQVTFDLEAEDVVYDSDDIIVFLPKSQHIHTGHFLFDLSRKKWEIDIPIKGGRCIEKKFKLPFENVSTQLNISGLALEAKDLKATSHGIDLKGKIIVDFSSSSFVDLQIFPYLMEGEVKSFISFVHLIPSLATFDLPNVESGMIKGHSSSCLRFRYNDKESFSEILLGLRIEHFSFAPYSGCEINGASFDVYFDSLQGSIEVKECTAKLALKEGEETKIYKLNAQHLHCRNLKEFEWEFDLRVEAPTFDLLRVAARTSRFEGGYKLDFKRNSNFFYGAKYEIYECLLDSLFSIKKCYLFSEFSLNDLLKQLQFLQASQMVKVTEELHHYIKTIQGEGSFVLNLDYDKSKQSFDLFVKAKELEVNGSNFGELAIDFSKKQNRASLRQFQLKDLLIKGEFETTNVGLNLFDWKLKSLEGNYKESQFSFSKGAFKEGSFNGKIDSFYLNLAQIAPLAFSNKNLDPFMVGQLFIDGDMQFDFKNGLSNLKANLICSVTCDNFSLANLSMRSKEPFLISYTLNKELKITSVDLSFNTKEQAAAYLDLRFKEAIFSFEDKMKLAKRVNLVLPPEMLTYLIDHKMVNGIKEQGGKLSFKEHALLWENEIDTEFDVAFDDKQIQIQGTLKEGYYWIEGESIFLQRCYYFMNQENLNLICGVDYKKISIDLQSKMDFKEELGIKISLKEGHSEEEDRKSLDFHFKSSQEEGVYLQNVEGSLFGVDISLRRNPRTYAPDVMSLTGQMKIDTFALMKSFPKLFSQKFRDLGMGSGYELSGDFILCKKQLKNSYFKGFLKGRDFEFLGFYFKTLMSEVEMNASSILVHEFSLSDVSGVMQIKELKLLNQHGAWMLFIPEIVVQDFRPSILKKQEFQEEKMKPFMIKDLHFFSIEGTLGQMESFRGKGHLDFINTFKRETNILDIPIEIIGRIGFDPLIFIPVIGKFEFEMKDGKIFLKDLKNAYSDGKRSRFYLSSYKDSFIGLDGELFIDIKMKQYVLLKITEPFTLSIRGNLSKPKYSLR